MTVLSIKEHSLQHCLPGEIGIMPFLMSQVTPSCGEVMKGRLQQTQLGKADDLE